MIQDRPMMKDRVLSWLGAITNVNMDEIGIFSPLSSIVKYSTIPPRQTENDYRKNKNVMMFTTKIIGATS